MARCADLFYFGKDCIVVAVDQKLFYILHMAGAQSLRPELIAASAPVRNFSKAKCRLKRFLIHVGEHQHFVIFRILYNNRNHAVAVCLKIRPGKITF